MRLFYRSGKTVGCEIGRIAAPDLPPSYEIVVLQVSADLDDLVAVPAHTLKAESVPNTWFAPELVDLIEQALFYNIPKPLLIQDLEAILKRAKSLWQ